MNEILQHQGLAVCGTAFGRQLRDGLFEFRLREKGLLLRVLCHAYGDKLILLLGGYDKAEDPSAKRQQSEIEEASRRLRAWELAKRRPS
jgi:putative component of toxin-antitoxin plasmid stabilization module